VLIFASAAHAALPRGTPDEARAFVKQVNEDLRKYSLKQSTADWIKANFITEDTERASAWANDDLIAYTARALQEAQRYQDLALDPDTARAIYLLKVNNTVLAPNDPKHRAELTEVLARMEGQYGAGKDCGPDGKGECRDLEQLSDVMDQSRDPAALLAAWVGWHNVARSLRPLYERFVVLGNEGARDNGFADLGALWKSAYDMSPEAFEKETDRIWGQVKPLYDDLHCYVRAGLQKKYGKSVVPDGQPIPAHLLGNMWAQEWDNIYDIVAPTSVPSTYDLEAALKRQIPNATSTDRGQQLEAAKALARYGDSFYMSLGFDALPETFYQRSQFIRPRDRDVECHASALDMDANLDLRIKMCIHIDADNFVTVHHEEGHNEYQRAYRNLPFLFRNGANDGFHEAIGDSIALAITPEYLKQLHLIDTIAPPRPTSRSNSARLLIRWPSSPSAF